MAIALTKTRADIRNEALQNVGAASSADSPPQEDADLADGKIDGMFLQLEADGIIDMPNTEEIPNEWYDDLVLILTQLLAPKFGGATDYAAIAGAEARLRRRVSGRPTGERQLIEWF